jgi:hypothetical protein
MDMRRFKDWIADWTEGVPLYGKLLLLALMIMALVFGVIYPTVTSRKGVLYNDRILVPGTENGNTIYSAEVNGELWRFTVTPDKVVTFRCGDKEYGPYTVKEDPTAIPKESSMASLMTGVEVRNGEEILFRGGIYDFEGDTFRFNEDGTSADFTITATLGNGTMVDENGKVIDPMEPGAGMILRLVNGPEITHKGHGGCWLLGFFLSVVAGVYILFADELFRLKFIFVADNPEDIEPSSLELGLRPVAWTMLAVAALVIYIMGLQ